MIFYGANSTPIPTVRPLPKTTPEPVEDPTPEAVDVEPEINSNEDNKSGFAFFEKIQMPSFKLELPEFDRICNSGAVFGKVEAREAASNDELPFDEKKPFVQEYAEIFQTKSGELQTKVKDGWATTVETLQNLPETFQVKWNEAREIYHENKRLEALKAERAANPPIPKELTIP